MIVLAIIGSLMALLIPQVTQRLKSAKVKQTKVIMGQVIQALNNYQIDCGKFPANLDFLTKADPECQNWGPDPYMRKIPKDAWSHDFTYEVTGNNFMMKSAGDGKEITSEEMQ
jgi:general secretion pathway protein G